MQRRAAKHLPCLTNADGNDPTGKSPGQSIGPPVQPLLKIYSDFQKRRITLYPMLSCSSEGRCATSRNAERDAVDAVCTLDGRCGWRTAKACGPDAPTLASSLRQHPRAMVARKPG